MAIKTYNEALAEAFYEISELLAITGGGFFQVRAYQEASRMLTEKVYPISKQNASVEAFMEFPRIGQALAEKMMEYIETGHMRYLDQLREEVPKGIRELLKIPGLGPKKVGQLYLTAGIQSKKELIKKAKAGELDDLPGWGSTSVEKMLNAIGQHQEKKRRHPRKTAGKLAKKVVALLKKIPGARQIEIAGSYRRKSPTVGDIDILVSGKADPKKAEAAVRKAFKELTLLGSGETKLSFMIFPQNLQIDIRFVPEESYGAALLYFTGSKDYNVKMRREAIRQGFLLNEYGLFKAGEYAAGKSEEEVYDALGMKWVQPEKRR